MNKRAKVLRRMDERTKIFQKSFFSGYQMYTLWDIKKCGVPTVKITPGRLFLTVYGLHLMNCKWAKCGKTEKSGKHRRHVNAKVL